MRDTLEIKKITQKCISMFLAGTLIATVLTGCKKKSLFEDTLLENAVVLYVDDQPLIVRQISIFCTGRHYQDVVTGLKYHLTLEKSDANITYCLSDQCISLDKDTKIESLNHYLTAEEMEKAGENKFTDADVVAVEKRILEESKTLKK